MWAYFTRFMWLTAWKASATEKDCLKAGEAGNRRQVVVYLKMEQKMVISLNGFWKNEFSVSRSLNHYLVCTDNWSAVTSWLRFSSFGWSYYKKTLWFKKNSHSGISRYVVVDKNRVIYEPWLLSGVSIQNRYLNITANSHKSPTDFIDVS